MPRNMSFTHTIEQFRDRTKTVTRRPGWLFLKHGDILNACEKCQGLKRGEKIKVLGQIRVLNPRRESLDTINKADVIAEGFPKMSPAQFIEFFCKHMKVKPETIITRIKFEHLTKGKDYENLNYGMWM